MPVPRIQEPSLSPPPVRLQRPTPGQPPRDATPSEPAGPSAFAALLHGLGREVNRGEGLVAHAMDASQAAALQPSELIALQAGVYRYAEAVDLAAKLVDHATSGLKTVVQGQ